MLVRGNRILQTHPPTGDATWTLHDRETAKTTEARWISLGVSDTERVQLLPCLIWKKKLPGLQYPIDIESRLADLQCKN